VACDGAQTRNTTPAVQPPVTADATVEASTVADAGEVALPPSPSKEATVLLSLLLQQTAHSSATPADYVEARTERDTLRSTTVGPGSYGPGRGDDPRRKPYPALVLPIRIANHGNVDVSLMTAHEWYVTVRAWA